MGVTSVETMAFVRAGGKTIPYRKHEYTEEYCQRYGYPCHYQSQGEEIELEKLKADYAALNNKNISDWEHNELSQEFAFGSRYYECLIAPPGVGYRNSPSFADKDNNNTGPESPQVIEADAIVQGLAACFIRCKTTGLWLLLTDPQGQRQCFKHMGKTSEVNLEAMGKKVTTKHMNKMTKLRGEKGADGQKAAGTALAGTGVEMF